MSTAVSIFLVYMMINYLNFFSQSYVHFNINGFERYENFINSMINKLSINFNPIVKKIMILFIPLSLFALILHLIKSSLISNFMINTMILFYGFCYQPKIEILPNLPEHQAAEIFSRPISRHFTVVFWFVLIGPMGVLLYDFVRRMEWQRFKNLLEFPSARLLSIGYALAGHFMPVFSYGFQHFFSGKISNTEYVENCGFLALHGKIFQEINLIEFNELNLSLSRALVKRAQIMLFLMLLIFSARTV